MMAMPTPRCYSGGAATHIAHGQAWGWRLRSIRRVQVFNAAVSEEGLVARTAAQTLQNGSAATPVTTEEVLSRIGKVSRVTKETSVDVKLNLDGTGICNCNTGIPFLDHMLDQLASHGLLDVEVTAKGDIHIDDHHTNEDIGLAVGTELLQALGDRKGIYRFGDFNAPLDEALVHVVLDLSGRPYLGFDVNIPTQRVGTYDTVGGVLLPICCQHFWHDIAYFSVGWKKLAPHN